jgi:hypothetical protein
MTVANSHHKMTNAAKWRSEAAPGEQQSLTQATEQGALKRPDMHPHVQESIKIV